MAIAPPDPAGVRSYDELSARLQELRAWSGTGYRELYRRVAARRRRRSTPDLSSYNAVYRCLQPGRSRLDVELIVDIACALTGDDADAAVWRQACGAIAHRHEAARVVKVAGTLPDDLAEFVGREHELGQLTAHRPGDLPVVLAISGMAGVGKSTLAVRAGHVLRRRSAGPTLAVDLRGFDPDTPPADPAAVLDGMLRQLGVPGRQLHTLTAAERSQRFRRLVGGQDLLMLLDNAASAAQIRPLLPGTPGSVVLVTSRHRLDGLPAEQLPLDVPSVEEALALLAAAAGPERVAAEPDAARRITALLGQLPLAVAVAARAIRTHPDWSLADQLGRLTERSSAHRLEPGLEIALRQSYDDLPAGHRWVLRALSAHPGRDFDSAAVAALAGCPPEATAAVLAELARAALLRVPRTGRYQLHDLVRVFVTAVSQDADPPRVRRAAAARLAEHYLAAAELAVRHYLPAELRAEPPAGPAARPPVDWLDSERANLIAIATDAARHGAGEVPAQLSKLLFRYLDKTGALDDAEILHRAAADCNEGVVRGRALSRLGWTYWKAGRIADTIRIERQALALARAAGDEAAEGNAIGHLAGVAWWQGEYDEALGLTRQVLAIRRRQQDRYGEGMSLLNLAEVYDRLGRAPDAADCHRQVLTIAAELDSPLLRLNALLGSATADLLDPATAGRLDEALRLARRVADRDAEVRALGQLGLLAAQASDPTESIALHEQALTIATETGQPIVEAQALCLLGDSYRILGQQRRALPRYRAALRLAGAVGLRYEQARAQQGITECLATADTH